jgi:hypothetical protein
MVVILSPFSAWIPTGVICEGSALRKRRSDRVLGVDGVLLSPEEEETVKLVVVGYPPIERKLWTPSIGMNGGEGRAAIAIKTDNYFLQMIGFKNYIVI